MPDQPILIVMRGPPGAGKSTIARAMARALRIPLIDKDDVKDILDSPLPDTRLAGAVAYDCMWRVVERQLAVGLGVIADSPLTGAEGYQRMAALRDLYGIPVLLIQCTCSDAVLWQTRIEARRSIPGLPAHHTTRWPGIEHVRAHEQAAPAWDPTLVLDTVSPVNSLLERALAWVGQTTSVVLAPPRAARRQSRVS